MNWRDEIVWLLGCTTGIASTLAYVWARRSR